MAHLLSNEIVKNDTSSTVSQGKDILIQLPSWLTVCERYTAPSDADQYIGKSLFKMCDLLEKLNQPVKHGKVFISPVFKVLYCVELILLISLSRQFVFPIILGIGLLMYLAVQPGKNILYLLQKSFLAAAFAFIVMIPSIWLGNLYSWFIIPGKTFLTVSFMAILAHTTPWNRITSALSQLYIPNLVVMILDLTIQYIFILGAVSYQILQALQLRSVGKNDKKYQSLAGAAGITFLKSKEFSEETYQAMTCRCFTGTYKIPRTHTFHWTLIGYCLIFAGTYVFYVWSEGLII